LSYKLLTTAYDLSRSSLHAIRYIYFRVIRVILLVEMFYFREFHWSRYNCAARYHFTYLCRFCSANLCL